MVLALNTISGQISDISPKLLEHPAFKNVLRVVKTDAKPYVAELYKPGTVEEKLAEKPKKVSFVKEPAIAEEPKPETKTEEDK